jgi:plastocyanin
MTGSRLFPVPSLAVACALVALFGAGAAAAHDLKGKLLLLAKGGKLQDKSADVANAVLIYRPEAAPKALATNRTYQIATRQKEFVPRMLTVPLGATVTFPNDDPILHNVFSVSGANRFDLGLYRKGPGKSWTFKNPGAVRVFCNVHHSMVAYVYVSDSPYFTSPDASGAFTLAGLPEGGGTLEVWHEQTEGMKREIAANQRGPLDLQVEITRPRIPAHMNKTGKPYAKDARGDY